MADAEEVSSTTPNEVVEEPKAREEFGDEKNAERNNEAAALQDGNVGAFNEEQVETEVEVESTDKSLPPEVVASEAHSTFKEQPVKEQEEEEEEKEEEEEEEEKETMMQIADKAEVELQEKSRGWIPEPVEQFEVKKELDVSWAPEKEVEEEEEVKPAVPVAAAAAAAEWDVTRVEELFQSNVVEKKVIQELEVTTTHIEEEKKVEAVRSEQDVAAAPVVAEPVLEPERSVTAALEEPSPTAATEPAHEASLPPSSAAAPFPPLMQFTSENRSCSPIASQADTNVTMDSFGDDSPSRSVPRYDPDVLNQSDDDLMFEMKKNPFQGFSPVDKPSSEFSHFGETTADTREVKMSDSPSPDLVQNAHDGDQQDDAPSEDYEQSFDSREAATESLRQQLASSDLFSTTPKENEESGLPPSLPDILKSSPLNPGKADSGSSEGSPDYSPVHRSGNDSPNAPFSLSGNNPFGFETKVPLLKEMAEETEAKAAEKAKLEEDVQMFGTFDLVKEAETSPKGNVMETVTEDQEDFKTSSQDSVQMVDRFECLSFPTGKTQEHSDSESPSADSLSPVLEAMAKNPSSFQIEPEKNIFKEEEEEEEEAEAADEVSEQEVSSEEFEFVEKPPRGAIDEFLETLDNSKFAKSPEMADEDEELAPKLEEKATDLSPVVQEVKSQSSYLLLTEPLDGTSPARSKAGLELADFEVPAPAPVVHPPVVKTETAVAKNAESKAIKLPNLSAGAVVDLLYWRDVKTTGVVFGACLLLLLSLSVCSIISVLSYVALALLSVTVSFRIYKGIIQAIQKSDEGHPFKYYLEQDVALSNDLVHKYSETALSRINAAVIELRRLFLVEDLVDSLKFAVFMWILTYVGALFNGLTILILGLIGVFTCPIVYEKHQTQIDHYFGMVNTQIKDIMAKVQAKIPGLKKKAE